MKKTSSTANRLFNYNLSDFEDVKRLRNLSFLSLNSLPSFFKINSHYFQQNA